MSTIQPNSITTDRLAALLARARASKSTEPLPAAKVLTLAIGGTINLENSELEESRLSAHTGVDKSGKVISYNTKQVEFMELAGTGKSCILIGAAGTGKTTCMRGAISTLIHNNIAGILLSDGHKTLPSLTPGIVCVSFTRRAVANLRRAMPDDMKANCLTIHALLEYEPVYYDIIDPETGKESKTMRFEPTRNIARPLPSSIKTVVIDESSMVSVELFNQLSSALPIGTQFIFLGDIQQLPPVFGAAILGYKMLELPTVELTEVYRQALESPIIRLAHRILSGKAIPAKEYAEWKIPNQLTIHPWKKKIAPDIACLTIAKFLTTAIDAGAYNPDEDMVLIPFNKACGTIELNKHIAQHQARARKAIVWEIVAGFNKHYLSIGDKVLYDKEDAIITNITVNHAYSGGRAQPESLTLDYWGYDEGDIDVEHTPTIESATGDEDIDFLLAQSVALGGTDDADRVRQASHCVTVKILETDRELKLDTAADINALLLSYALTVHKSQGSEFRKVFLTLHGSHSTMIQRELLYTAVTRAREELYIICEDDTFTKGILSQRIKGNSLEEKAEYFKGLVNKREAALITSSLPFHS